MHYTDLDKELYRIENLINWKSILSGLNPLRPSEAYHVSKLINIGSDNGLSSDRRQAIIWTNAEIFPTSVLRNDKNCKFIFMLPNRN